MSNAPHEYRVDAWQEEDGNWIARVRGIVGLTAYGPSRESAIASATILARRTLEHEDRQSPPCSPFPPEADLHLRLGTHTNMDGTIRPEVSICGNRSAFKWLADQCLQLAFAGDTAIESGFHIHVDSGNCPEADFKACVTLRIMTHQELCSLRRADGLCIRCGRKARSKATCPYCGAAQNSDDGELPVSGSVLGNP